MKEDNEPTGLRGLWQSLDERELDQVKFLLRTLGVVVLFVLLAAAVAGVIVTII